MDTKNQINLLYPPGEGRVAALLRWIDAWRAVPISAFEENGAKEPFSKAREYRWVHLFDTAVGPMVGLNAEGLIRIGAAPSRSVLSFRSLRGLELRGLLYFAARQKVSRGAEIEVLGFTRHHLRVKLLGRPGLLGFETGDYPITLSKRGKGFLVELPKQFDVSEYDLEDGAWWLYSKTLLPSPTKPFRGAYWMRTLLDGYRAWRLIGRKALMGRGEEFYRSVRNFAKKYGSYLSEEAQRRVV